MSDNKQGLLIICFCLFVLLVMLFSYKHGYAQGYKQGHYAAVEEIISKK